MLGGYVVLMLGGFSYFDLYANMPAFLSYTVVVTVIFIVVVAAKGERPVRWRWGKE